MLFRSIASYNILTKFRNQNENDALEYYFSNKEINSELKEWINNKKETLRKKHLFEMTEEIINILKSEDSKKDIAFIQAFQDIIQEFSSSETADLATFLEWWDEIGKTKTITSPDNQDAIRIITIHKSKGLGFNNVIIPFASWAIDHEPTKNNLIWCKPSVEPFNRIPVIALKYSKTLNNSIYENEYRREKLNAFIDNLNVAYVAFTRAKNELIILCPNPKKSESNSDINSLLKSVSEWAANIKTNDNIDLKEYFDNEENVLELGNWKEYNNKKEVVKANIFNEYYSDRKSVV